MQNSALCRPVTVAVAGGGKIVPEFLKAAHATEGLAVRGLWARRAEVRAQLAAAYALPVAYESYEALLADPAVDAVYVALPNHLHLPFALRALDAGKDVLLEKPLTVTRTGAQQLFDRAAVCGRVVFETITNRYGASFDAAAAQLSALGRIRLVMMNYSQYSSRYERFCAGITDPVFDPRQAGGALMDLNVYNIHLAVGWFGSPQRVHYAPNCTRGIDTSGVLLMEYPDFSCVCAAAKDCNAPAEFTVQGDRGYLRCAAPPNVFPSFSLCLNGEAPRVFDAPQRASRMCGELDAFCTHRAAGDAAWFEQQAAHSLRVMAVLDEAVRSGGLTLGGA